MAGGVVALEEVGAAGDLGGVPVAGLGVVDGLSQQLGGELAGDGGAVLGVLHVALRGDDMEGTGPGGGVGDVVVVGQLLSLDGDGVGHVVHQVDALEGVGRAVQPALIAHHGVAAVAGVAVHAGHGLAVLQQHGEDVVLGGDGGAVAPHQALVDGDGVGLGAVLVLGLLVGGHGGVVVLELPFLGEDHGVVAAMDQVVHVVVGLGGREPGVIELVEHVIDGADDQLAGGLSGLFAGLASFGIRARGALRLRGAHL